MRVHRGLIAVGSLLAVTFTAAAYLTFGQSAGSALKMSAGTSAAQTYHVQLDGMDRQFIVYRPKNLPVQQVAPVVFMYHGGSGTGEKFYQTSGWRQEADKYGFMAVFPTAAKYYVYADHPGDGLPAVYETRWSAYHLDQSLSPDYPNQVIADDVAFTRAMVTFIGSRYAVDTNRIYAAGFSSGGTMVTRLMSEASDVFAAFASSSSGLQDIDLASALQNAPNDFVPRPVIGLVGSKDSKLTATLGVTSFPLDESAAAPTSAMREMFFDRYLSLLGLDDTYTFSKQGKLSSFAFTTAAQAIPDNVEYLFLIAANMDHIFPNGSNYPVSAASVFWSFFKTFSLN